MDNFRLSLAEISQKKKKKVVRQKKTLLVNNPIKHRLCIEERQVVSNGLTIWHPYTPPPNCHIHYLISFWAKSIRNKGQVKTKFIFNLSGTEGLSCYLEEMLIFIPYLIFIILPQHWQVVIAQFLALISF